MFSDIVLTLTSTFVVVEGASMSGHCNLANFVPVHIHPLLHCQLSPAVLAALQLTAFFIF
jgi:hypothetical protein